MRHRRHRSTRRHHRRHSVARSHLSKRRLYSIKKFIIMAILMTIKFLVIKSVMLSIVINPHLYMGNFGVLHQVALTLGIYHSSSVPAYATTCD
jgi:hypothetical protein